MANVGTKLGVAGGIIGAMVAAAVTQAGVRRLFERSEPDMRSQAFLSQVASETNKTLPSTVDKETELINTTGLEGVFVYNYRLVNTSASDVNPAKLVEVLRPQIQSSACTLPATRDTFLKKGVTLRYSYADSQRAFLASIDITPKDCGF